MSEAFLFVYTETPLRITDRKVGTHRLTLRRGFLPCIPASFIERSLSIQKSGLKDATLLFLPISSLIGVVLYATSPKAVRKARFSSFNPDEFNIEESEAVVCKDADLIDGSVLLTETLLKGRREEAWERFCSEVADSAFPCDDAYGIWRDTLSRRAVLVHDTFFEYLLLRSLQMTPRLLPEGSVEYEERVPQDALFVSPLVEGSLLGDLCEEIKRSKLVRIGAGSALGHGFCRIRLIGG